MSSAEHGHGESWCPVLSGSGYSRWVAVTSICLLSWRLDSETRVPAGQVLERPLLGRVIGGPFCVLTGHRAEGKLRPESYEDSNPIMGPHACDVINPDHLPRPHLLILPHCGVRAFTCGFGGTCTLSASHVAYEVSPILGALAFVSCP